MNNDVSNSLKWWTLAALLGLLYWLFGNAYEAIVFSPNWVTDSEAQFTRLNEFFIRTGPTLYFVPLTQIALVAVWILWWKGRQTPAALHYRRAGLLAVVLAAVTAYIVVAVLPTLFGDNYAQNPGSLESFAWRWNVLNVVRMSLTTATAIQLFQAFRVLDRSAGNRDRTLKAAS